MCALQAEIAASHNVLDQGDQDNNDQAGASSDIDDFGDYDCGDDDDDYEGNAGHNNVQFSLLSLLPYKKLKLDSHYQSCQRLHWPSHVVALRYAVPSAPFSFVTII